MCWALGTVRRWVIFHVTRGHSQMGEADLPVAHTTTNTKAPGSLPFHEHPLNTILHVQCLLCAGQEAR
jgi:hypothetical protein